MDYAFDWCQQMTKLEFDPDSELSIIQRSFCVASAVRSIRIPAFVKSIGISLFDRSTVIKKIYFAGGELSCDTNFTKLKLPDFAIYVLPNYPSQTFCSKQVNIISKLPTYHTKSCAVNNAYSQIRINMLSSMILTID